MACNTSPRGIMGLVVRPVEPRVAGDQRVSPPDVSIAFLRVSRESSLAKPRQYSDARWAGAHPHLIVFCPLQGKEGATGLTGEVLFFFGVVFRIEFRFLVPEGRLQSPRRG